MTETYKPAWFAYPVAEADIVRVHGRNNWVNVDRRCFDDLTHRVRAALGYLLDTAPPLGEPCTAVFSVRTDRTTVTQRVTRITIVPFRVLEVGHHRAYAAWMKRETAYRADLPDDH